MRTTLTLDPDVSERLRQRMRLRKQSFKETINEALRIGLGGAPSTSQPRFVVEPHASPFVAGIDPQRLNQAVDEFEAEVAIPGRET